MNNNAEDKSSVATVIKTGMSGGAGVAVQRGSSGKSISLVSMMRKLYLQEVYTGKKNDNKSNPIGTSATIARYGSDQIWSTVVFADSDNPS